MASLPLSGNRLLQCPPPSAAPVRLCACKSVKHCLLVQAAVNHQIAGSRSHNCPPERRMAVDLRQPQIVPLMTKLPTAACTLLARAWIEGGILDA